jgi:hypothetical protein
MEKLTEAELIQIFDSYINENGLWLDFLNKLKDLGYSEEDYDKITLVD